MENKNISLNLSWKQRIVFALSSGVVYSVVLYLFDRMFDDNLYSLGGLIFQGVFFGLFFGLGFPYLMGKYGTGMINKLGNTINPELFEDELIECDFGANLFRGIEGVGGKVFLTNKKLIFKAHKFNIQNGQSDFAYEEIVSLTKRKTGGIVDNGVRLQTKDGKNHDFVLNEREIFLEKLNEKI